MPLCVLSKYVVQLHIHKSLIQLYSWPLSQYVNSFNFDGNFFHSAFTEYYIILMVSWDNIFPVSHLLLLLSALQLVCKFVKTCHLTPCINLFLFFILSRPQFTVNVRPHFLLKYSESSEVLFWLISSPKWSMTLSINIFKIYFQYTFLISGTWSSFVGAQ